MSYRNVFSNAVASDGSVNAHALLAYDSNSAGTIGIAWIATVCHSNPRYRSSITEWFINDMEAGDVSIEPR